VLRVILEHKVLLVLLVLLALKVPRAKVVTKERKVKMVLLEHKVLLVLLVL
jgi:hypothetical protein